MHQIIEIALRSFLAVGTLFLLTKLMGRKELSQLSIFDYIIGISIGTIAAQMAFDVEETWYEFMIVLMIYVGSYLVIDYLGMKSLWMRKFFEGAPIVLMQDGKLIYKNLKRVRYDINTFLETCRMAGYFDLSKIDIAIMESSGRISFLPKAAYRVVAVGDLALKTSQETLVANVIIDGKLLKSNIKAIGKDRLWLEEQLSELTQKPLENILLATYDEANGLKVYFKDESIHVQHCLE